MRASRTPKQVCPHDCGYTVDAHTFTEDPDASIDPEVGDLSICLRCGGVSAFGSSGLLEKLTEKEVESLPLEVLGDIARARFAQSSIRKTHNGP